MIWGRSSDGTRIKAQPNTQATCPICDSELTPKCGVVKRWHWAHRNSEDCDSWNEGETEWHLNWKMLFPAKNQEVIVGKHRADIKTDSGRVIELQNSSISREMIREREDFYDNMVWLLNGKKFAKNLILRPKNNYYTFRWKWAPSSWFLSEKEIFIDLDKLNEWLEKGGNLNFYKSVFTKGIFHIKKLYNERYCGGWGVLLTREEFLKQYGN